VGSEEKERPPAGRGSEGTRVGDVGVERDCTGARERRMTVREGEPEGGYRWWRMVHIRGPGGGVGGGDSSGSCGQSEGIVAMATGRLRPPACSTQRSLACRSTRAGERRGHAYTRERLAKRFLLDAHTLASPSLHPVLARARAYVPCPFETFETHPSERVELLV